MSTLPHFKYISIEQITDKTAIPFTDLEKSEKYASDIVNIFNGQLKKTSDSHLNYAIAGYYFNKKEYSEMKKYYLMAIKQNHTNAMYCLALYYIKETSNTEMALKYMKMAIEQNNTLAMIWIGDYHRYVCENYTDMMKYYLMAVKNGNSDGIINIANYYKDIKNDHQATKRYYINAVEKGNHKGMFLLAEYYYVIENNMEEAKKYYVMASERGNSLATYLTGVFYFKIDKDIPTALKYFKLAADNGNSNAMHGLANYYYDIEKNIDEGVRYYTMASENGNPDSMVSLFRHYYKLQDFPMMIKYAELGVTYGNIELANQLGMHYSYVENNHKKAMEYFMIGVKKDNNESLFCLALQYYATGDIEKYEKYLIDSCNQGNVTAARYLGFYYQNYKKDNQKGLEYFKIAVDKDDVESFMHIGLLYNILGEYDLSLSHLLTASEKGYVKASNYVGFYYQNEKQDYPTALSYFKLGVEKDDTEATLNIASLYYIMGEFDLSEKYFLIAVEKGDEVAANNLGFYFQNVKKDYENAIKYYKLAEERGEQYSIYNLYTLFKKLGDNQGETEKYYQKVLEINSKTSIFKDLLD